MKNNLLQGALVDDHSMKHLRIFEQLAREYEKKFKELEEIVQHAPPQTLHHQLRLRGELTTDRFRAAQLALLATLAPSSPVDEGDEAYKAAITLCRCFDEMRILFQAALERPATSEE